MDKSEIIRKIEDFAPPELAESWDCSGWLVETPKQKIKRVMLCLTVTEDIIKQAREKNCDMIISHHPLFAVSLAWKDIDIYCAHTNLDLAEGGTTDALIKTLNFEKTEQNGFVRYVCLPEGISVDNFTQKLSKISPNLRYTNNKNETAIKKLGFCAGSGAEFLQEAFENGADAFVTGDVKFHTAVESQIVLFDIGHFESEILVLDVFEKLLGNRVEILRAKEQSPFIY